MLILTHLMIYCFIPDGGNLGFMFCSAGCSATTDAGSELECCLLDERIRVGCPATHVLQTGL